jgi:hypothetical protein
MRQNQSRLATTVFFDGETAMRRTVQFAAWIGMLVTIGGGAVLAQESLGQAAKNAQAQKKSAQQAKKVYTNDDIASVVIPAAEKSPDPIAFKDEAKPADAKTSDEKAANKGGNDEKSDEKSKESAAAYKQGVLDQQLKVKDTERELGLMEREHQVRVAAYYADAGNQLRDSKKWFEDEKKYNDDLAAKKKDLADAKEKLESLQEEARKAGIPLSRTEE